MMSSPPPARRPLRETPHLQVCDIDEVKLLLFNKTRTWASSAEKWKWGPSAIFTFPVRKEKDLKNVERRTQKKAQRGVRSVSPLRQLMRRDVQVLGERGALSLSPSVPKTR
jgi:hypothetical protein